MIDAHLDYQRTLLEIVSLAIAMRRLQRVYFRMPQGDRRKAALQDALVAERQFDEAIAKLKAPELKL